MAYLPLSTANLPDPAIDPAAGENPTDYFNTVLYTGNGGTNRSITGMNFQADFLWHKDRSATRNHSLVDVIRGTNDLQSNDTAAERSMPSFVSFDSDGFTVTQDGSTNPNWNENSITKVVWGWKANGSGVSNTDGNVTSTVSADTTSGFSVVTWTGSESVSDQIGHGLSQKPDVIIARRRDGTHSWVVWGEAIGTASNSRLFLNTTAAIGTTGSVGASTNTYFAYDVGGGESWLAYCFHSVEAFSKFGSYTGNGSSDGVFVYTGFRVGWLMVKRTDDAFGWYIHDAVRDPFNHTDSELVANSDGAEYSREGAGGGEAFDFVANGFKVRTANTALNASGGTYIYMAFAEQPFKFSNAR
jgi:hypothetical protein